MSGILAIVQLLSQIIDGIKSITGFIQANKNEKWFQDSAQAFTELRNCKTDQDYKDAAKKLRDVFNSAG